MVNDTIKTIKKVTMTGVWINALLVIMKIFFGYWGNSDALVADGYHSMSDFITDVIVIVFVAASYKKADSGHPYGHGKFETIATVLIGLILFIVGAAIGYAGGIKLASALNGEILPQPDILTLYIAIVSIALKEFCYRYTLTYGKKLNSSALIANAWHHRSDAISSVATVVGVSFAIFLGMGWRIMDPIASILIAIMICVSAIKIAMPSVKELLEVSLPEEDVDKLRGIITSVPGVLKVHNLRARMNGHSCIVDVNIHINPDITVRAGHRIATEVEQKLKREFAPDIIIYVHIEPQD